jgi:DNA-binding SARP family transcriptional activator
MFYKIPQLIKALFKPFFQSSPINSSFSTDLERQEPEQDDDLPKAYTVITMSKKQETVSQKSKTIVLKVQFLGKFRVEVNDKPLILTGKNALIFASLLLEYPREIHKETLMHRFWADNLSAKNSLNVAICSIRKSLKEILTDREILVFDAHFYTLSHNVFIETDIEQFKKVRQEAISLMRHQGLPAAVEHFEKLLWLYNGDFLENYPNDTWALGERDSYFEYYFEALRLLSEHYEKVGNMERCIEYCRQMLRHDAHFEPIHRRLIQAYTRLGAKDKAMRQYQECLRSLKQINILPSRETQELFKQLND